MPARFGVSAELLFTIAKSFHLAAQTQVRNARLLDLSIDPKKTQSGPNREAKPLSDI
jgi:hypothetical protein